MNSSRLIQLLEDLSRKELRELQQFIHCEFFHSNRRQYEKVLQLFLSLISPRFKILKPDRRELAVELFGESDDSDRNLSLHISQAIDLVQKYMVQK
ncbi:MAG: hypothetical protein R3E32_18005 [Chitinophagales bacterium]